MKITVFRHVISHGIGTFGHAIEKAGLTYHYVEAYHEDFSGFDACGPDILMIMGGVPGVYNADHYPFMHQEMNIIEKRLAAELPVLGVCLGAQMIAKVLGANVYPGPQGKEKGWFPIRVTEDGLKTPVRHLDGSQTNMIHWHGDTFDLPEGSTLLASSGLYRNQIFSWGTAAIGLQCHAEVTPNILKSWLVSSVSDVVDGTVDPEKIRRETDAYSSTLMSQTEKFMSEWLQQARIVCESRAHA